MAHVLGVHEVELKPGVDPSEFEQAAADVIGSGLLPGWTTRILRGERGPRVGKYLIVFEVESVEARDRFFPEEGQESPSEDDEFDPNSAQSAAWERLDPMFTHSSVGSDYVELG